MTKKLEYAIPNYYCELKTELDEPYSGGNECDYSPHPNCRSCIYRPDLEKKVEYRRILKSIYDNVIVPLEE